tara:strand:- start:706 stop:909 length:204 start_codon:yes stop_codon:yes gene_type:complete
LDEYINVAKVMEQWASLGGEVKQIIYICLMAVVFGLWMMMSAMEKLDEMERERKEAIRYEEENFTIE